MTEQETPSTPRTRSRALLQHLATAGIDASVSRDEFANDAQFVIRFGLPGVPDLGAETWRDVETALRTLMCVVQFLPNRATDSAPAS